MAAERSGVRKRVPRSKSHRGRRLSPTAGPTRSGSWGFSDEAGALLSPGSGRSRGCPPIRAGRWPSASRARPLARSRCRGRRPRAADDRTRLNTEPHAAMRMPLRQRILMTGSRGDLARSASSPSSSSDEHSLSGCRKDQAGLSAPRRWTRRRGARMRPAPGRSAPAPWAEGASCPAMRGAISATPPISRLSKSRFRSSSCTSRSPAGRSDAAPGAKSAGKLAGAARRGSCGGRNRPSCGRGRTICRHARPLGRRIHAFLRGWASQSTWIGRAKPGHGRCRESSRPVRSASVGRISPTSMPFQFFETPVRRGARSPRVLRR